MSFFERLQNVVLHTYVKWSFYYYVRQQDAYVDKIFGTGYPDVNEMLKDVDLVLINHHYALNNVKAYTPTIVPVAGMHIVDRDDILPQVFFLIENKISI